MCETKLVKLGQYKGLSMKTQPITVTEAEIDNQIGQILAQNTNEREANDRPVQMGDTISLNFAGFCDGVQFDGGTAQNYKLVIGSHSFIDNFEEQLVGVEVGQEVEVFVTFPEHYGALELAGKPAKFICTVNTITEKVVPELTDGFCRKKAGCESIGEFREKVRAQLLDQKKEQMTQARIETLLARIIEDSEIIVPEGALKAHVNRRVNEFASQLMQQGMQLEQYCQMTGMSVEDMAAQILPYAELEIKRQIVMEEIAAAEGLSVPDDELEYQLGQFAAQYGMDPKELKKQLGAAELKNLKEEILLNKALEIVLNSVVGEA